MERKKGGCRLAAAFFFAVDRPDSLCPLGRGAVSPAMFQVSGGFGELGFGFLLLACRLYPFDDHRQD